MPVRVQVRGIPSFVDVRRLLGEGDWQRGAEGWSAELDRRAAADLGARLRGVVLGGQRVDCRVQPRLSRKLVRRARREEARRRRHSTPGFERKGVRMDEEGRWSLTPEALALELAERLAPATVVDGTCGLGGNAIAFARRGARVLAVERDRGRLALARHNARRYGVADRIRWCCGEAAREVPRHHADLLWLDPPWGEHYRKPMRPEQLPLVELAQQELASGRYGRVGLKLPPAVDPDGLPMQVRAVFGRGEGDRRRVKYLELIGPGGIVAGQEGA